MSEDLEDQDEADKSATVDVVLRIPRKELDAMKFVSGIDNNKHAVLSVARRGLRYLLKCERAFDNISSALGKLMTLPSVTDGLNPPTPIITPRTVNGQPVPPPQRRY